MGCKANLCWWEGIRSNKNNNNLTKKDSFLVILCHNAAFHGRLGPYFWPLENDFGLAFGSIGLLCGHTAPPHPLFIVCAASSFKQVNHMVSLELFGTGSSSRKV